MFSCQILWFFGFPAPCRIRVRLVRPGRGIPVADPAAPTLATGPLLEASGNPLRIKIYYILCSSAESTPIIVARPSRRKRFLMHRNGRGKASKNQALSAGFPFGSPTIHRRSTVSSTVAVDNLLVQGRASEFRFLRAGTPRDRRCFVGGRTTAESERFRLCRYRKRGSLGMISEPRGRL